MTDLVSYLVSLREGALVTGRMISRTLLLALLGAASVAAQGQVTFDRLVRASREPQNWLTYSGSYMSQRHSELTQITPENVKNLETAWILQLNSREPTNTRFEVTPVVVDGIMYMVQPPNDVMALDATNWTACFGPTRTILRHSRALAAGASTAASQFSAIGCSWGRSTGTCSHSTPRPARPLWDVSVVQTRGWICARWRRR